MPTSAKAVAARSLGVTQGRDSAKLFLQEQGTAFISLVATPQYTRLAAMGKRCPHSSNGCPFSGSLFNLGKGTEKRHGFNGLASHSSCSATQREVKRIALVVSSLSYFRADNFHCPLMYLTTHLKLPSTSIFQQETNYEDAAVGT